MKDLNYVFYCRRCKKLVKVYEAYVEEKVFPEVKPEFDVATWCCSICGEPIVQVSRKCKPGV
ncbi:MAG: hypothetical protein QXK12_00050 [Candidatus Nezhaarchaeales archaeon]